MCKMRTDEEKSSIHLGRHDSASASSTAFGVEVNDDLLLPPNAQTWYRQSSDVNHVEHLQKAFLYFTDLFVAFC